MAAYLSKRSGYIITVIEFTSPDPTTFLLTGHIVKSMFQLFYALCLVVMIYSRIFYDNVISSNKLMSEHGRNMLHQSS